MQVAQYFVARMARSYVCSSMLLGHQNQPSEFSKEDYIHDWTQIIWSIFIPKVEKNLLFY
jgi:hypothetical protein